MGVVFNRKYRRLGNAEYNYHDSFFEGIVELEMYYSRDDMY